MACYHPIEAWNISSTPGEVDLTFSRAVAANHGVPRPFPVPCRHCVGCRLDYSRQWADRCLLEMQDHDESWFLTLTYDDDHLPKTFNVDLRTGEAMFPVATLVSRDLQLFIKRLRKNSGQSIRYFACGEYGSTGLRPHYHMLAFGLRLDPSDLMHIGTSPLGDKLYQSHFLDFCWGKGYITIGSATWASAGYIARYTLKKIKGDLKYDDFIDAGLEPPFLRMSRRPGLGRNYLDAHPDLFRFRRINIRTETGGKSMPIPHYYRQIDRESNPEAYLFDTLERRRSFITQNSLKRSLTDLDLCDILNIEERQRLSSSKSLIRRL